MSHDARLNRIFRGLGAAERVALLSAALQSDEPMPHQVIGTMPRDQDEDFSELATLAAGTYRVLLPYAWSLRSEARALCLELQILTVLTAWGLDLASASTPRRSGTMPGRTGPRRLEEVLRDPSGDNVWEQLMRALAASLPMEAGDVTARLQVVQRVHGDVVSRLNPVALPRSMASVLGAAASDVDQLRQGLTVLSLDVPHWAAGSAVRLDAELRELIGLAP